MHTDLAKTQSEGVKQGGLAREGRADSWSDMQILSSLFFIIFFPLVPFHQTALETFPAGVILYFIALAFSLRQRCSCEAFGASFC